MHSLNLLKLCKKAIESGWLEVNADSRTLCYFLVSVVAFDLCSKLRMASEV